MKTRMLETTRPMGAVLLALLIGAAACGGGTGNGGSTGPSGSGAPAPSPGSPPPGAGAPPGSTPPPTAAAPPVITALSIHGAPPAGGTPVAISGTGFQAGLVVTFGGAAATCTPLDASAGSVDCTTPPQPEGLYDVVLTNPDGQSGTFTGFHYGPPPSPLSVFPGSAAPGATVTVLGNDLVAGMAGGTEVSIGGQSAVIVSSVRLSRATNPPVEDLVTVPNLASGSYRVVVTNPDGQQAVVPKLLTIP